MDMDRLQEAMVQGIAASDASRIQADISTCKQELVAPLLVVGHFYVLTCCLVGAAAARASGAMQAM